MTAKSQIDDLLAEFAAEGHRVSTGQFTLDPQRAREQLARYSSSNPDLFLLQFVRYAGLCQAKEANISLVGDELTLSHNGQYPSLDRLQNLVTQLKTNEAALTCCLWNALRFRCTEAHIATPDGSVRHNRQLEGQLGPGSASGHQFKVVLKLPVTAPQDRLTPPIGETQRDILNKSCAYSPVKVIYLGKPLERPEPQQLVFHSWMRPEHIKSLLPDPVKSQMSWPTVKSSLERNFITSSDYQGYLMLGQIEGPSRLEFVIQGICYPVRVDWLPPSSHALIQAENLRLDLSGEQIVQNESFHNLIQTLQNDIAAVMLKFSENLQPLPPAAAAHLELVVSQRLRAGDLTQASELCRWIYLKAYTSRVRKDFGRWQRASFVYRYSILSKMLKDGPGALRLEQLADKEWNLAAQGWMEKLRGFLNPSIKRTWVWWPLPELPPADLRHEELVEICRLQVISQTLSDGVNHIIPQVRELGDKCMGYSLGAALYCFNWMLQLVEASSASGQTKILETRLLVMDVTVRDLLNRKVDLQEWQTARSRFSVLIQTPNGKVAKALRAMYLEMLGRSILIDFQLEEKESAKIALQAWLSGLYKDVANTELREQMAREMLNFSSLLPNKKASEEMRGAIARWTLTNGQPDLFS